MRKLVFANNEIYHVFNRGIEKRDIFTNKREFSRAILTLNYYRLLETPLRLSKALQLEKEKRIEFFKSLEQGIKRIEVIAYCLMPNHFHLLLKQTVSGGLQRYLADFQNSYTRYFNTRHNKRNGPLFQGAFKAVHIEDDNQLIHVSRYIHINPVVSFLLDEEKLDSYEWSSYPEYVSLGLVKMCDTDLILRLFKSQRSYRRFVHNHIDYAKKLERIKHLVLE
ncbi:hypothetical protein A2714_04555 [Candidatus Woesebacteria bacterium RIFCSPHIGHO2_01_FULL_38_9]|uniref:Transposase IS200-like domain-containing protein n=2 Tax=Candidatus Woeseibacteriota TaxID=1752722 RepID=A0A1F7Y3R8_9BACT|nr:MAG: hypothetical protein A2714_04555 [Candidatus Woesebacteria bacterium RIFCSPHIGHO2_01_FULL_38_9]OGM60269.1 MAG: hypothetical protein A3A75_04125 [Candidatus Woesebacteria bacterium RIFCSPLOWO2_01_FULL_39_10]